MLGFNYFKEQYISFLSFHSLLLLISHFFCILHFGEEGGWMHPFFFSVFFYSFTITFFICPTLSSFCPFDFYIVLTGHGRSMKWLDTLL